MTVGRLRDRLPLPLPLAAVVLILALVVLGIACVCASDHPTKVAQAAAAPVLHLPPLVEMWSALLAIAAASMVVFVERWPHGLSPPRLARFLF